MKGEPVTYCHHCERRIEGARLTCKDCKETVHEACADGRGLCADCADDGRGDGGVPDHPFATCRACGYRYCSECLGDTDWADPLCPDCRMGQW